MNNRKRANINTVAKTFGQATEWYHKHAEIPKKVAEGLMSSLMPWQNIIPDGPILEVGCGTGFLTELLLKNFPEKEFMITDASSEMLRFCEDRLTEKGLLEGKSVEFEVLDAEAFNPEESDYAMVLSNFTPHWFKDTSIALEKLSEALVPGGLLLCSFPGSHTFEQWYEKCLELGVPFTANSLPNVEEVVVKLSMGPIQIDYYENDLYQEFESALDFFRHLKRTGASYPVKQKRLNYKQFKLLTDHWDEASNNIKIKWHIVYLAAKKDFQ